MRFASPIVAAVAFILGASAIAQQPVFDPGDGVSLPIVVKEVRAQYTQQALAAKIQGTVMLKSVVLQDGTVGDVEVEQSLDQELDQQAVNAMKQWEFKPGTKDGKPVAVRVHCEMTFTLK
jgi:protein TonB